MFYLHGRIKGKLQAKAGLLLTTLLYLVLTEFKYVISSHYLNFISLELHVFATTLDDLVNGARNISYPIPLETIRKLCETASCMLLKLIFLQYIMILKALLYAEITEQNLLRENDVHTISNCQWLSFSKRMKYL